jgi:hypothetical protein
MAGEDAGVLKRLERFQSPQDIWKSYTNIEKKRSSGEKGDAGPPEDAAALTAWRVERGIPEKAEGYFEKMGDLVIGDADKERANTFFDVAHGANLPPDAAKKLVEWSYQYEEKMLADRIHQDEVVKQEGTETLMKEWGAEYKGNLNAINGLLDMFPVDAKSAILDSRDETGDPIMSNPDILRGFVQLANEINPGLTILPAGGGGGIQTVQTQIAEIEQVMRTDRPRYNRDGDMQARLRKLYEARIKLESRKAG